MALPALIPAGGLIVKGVSAATAAKVAAGAAAAGAGVAVGKAAAGAKAKRAASRATAVSVKTVGLKNGGHKITGQRNADGTYRVKPRKVPKATGAKAHSNGRFLVPVATTAIVTRGASAKSGAGKSAASRAAPKTGFFETIWGGIASGFKAFRKFLTNNSDSVGRGVAVGASVLANSSFESKNKRVTFKGDTPARLGGYAFNVPSVQVTNLHRKNYKDNSSRTSNRGTASTRRSNSQKNDNSPSAPAPYRNKYPTRGNSNYRISPHTSVKAKSY